MEEGTTGGAAHKSFSAVLSISLDESLRTEYIKDELDVLTEKERSC